MNNKLKQIIREEVSTITESINDFKKALEAHDWYYMMSDESKRYTAGEAEQKALIKQAKELGAPGIKLYNTFYKKFFPRSTNSLKLN